MVKPTTEKSIENVENDGSANRMVESTTETSLEDPENDGSTNQEREMPDQKRQRISTQLHEDMERSTKESVIRAFGVPTHSTVSNLELSPNGKASAAWSSSEASNEQKLQLPIGTVQKIEEDTFVNPKKTKEAFIAEDMPEKKSGKKPQRNVKTTRASVRLPGTTIAKQEKKRFPDKLHELLTNTTIQEIVSWLPDGNSFVITSRDRFSKEVLPKYFTEVKFESFMRKLNRWSFKRISNDLYPDAFVYQHRLFKRDSPELCRGMSGGKIQDEDFSHLQDPDMIHGIGVTSPTVIHGTSIQEPAGPVVLGSASRSLPPSFLHSIRQPPCLTPFQSFLLEQQRLSTLAHQTLPLGGFAAQLQETNALTSNLVLRNRNLSTLQSPLELSLMGSNEALFGRYYGLDQQSQNPYRSFAETLHARANIMSDLDVRATVFRSHQAQNDSQVGGENRHISGQNQREDGSLASTKRKVKEG